MSLGLLADNPRLDTHCVTLTEAVAHSTNVAFARWSDRKLGENALRRAAEAFGFEQPIPFELLVEPSRAAIPFERLEHARAAAGFWHTTLSPLHGAMLAAAVANDGVAMRPRVVARVSAPEGDTLYEAPPAQVFKRVMRPRTAQELGEMMAGTMAFGTGRRAFSDRDWVSNRGDVRVAGKTGSLTSRGEERLHFSWFVGYAPVEAPRVAVGVMVVNPPRWRIRAPDVAREVLASLL